MEAEKEDPYASLLNFLPQMEPLESQIRGAGFAREFDYFPDTMPRQFFSAEPTMETDNFEIALHSLPDSISSVPSTMEEEPFFQTPPDNVSHLHHSSSECQSLDGDADAISHLKHPSEKRQSLDSEAVDLEGGRTRCKRVDENGTGDEEAETKKVRVEISGKGSQEEGSKELVDDRVVEAIHGPDEGEHVGVRDSSKRQLPRSMNTSSEEKMKKKNPSLLDILDDMKAYFARMRPDEDEDDIDLVETARKQGMTFPRPRWWPPEDT